MLSGDGRYVVFQSEASNLVANDTNVSWDVFVHDRQTATTSRVSLSSGGTQSNNRSLRPVLSVDGRYVAFYSLASNLVAGDTNGTHDVFVHDRQTGTTSRVSVASNGAQSNEGSDSPALSGDGRYIAFESWASNLAAGDTNDSPDVFVHDRQTGTTSRISGAPDGSQGNYYRYSVDAALSADGRYVAFTSFDTLVVDDADLTPDVFVHDRQTGTTVRVSVAPDGTQGDRDSIFSALSADGRYIAFESWASNLVVGDTNTTPDVFVQNLAASVPVTGTFAIIITPVNDAPTISAIADQKIPINSTTATLDIIIADTDTSVDALYLTAQLSNLTLVPKANIVLGGSGASRTVRITPAANQTGTATITLTVSDGAASTETSFLLRVQPPANYLPMVIR
jgi:hypothetical protein